MPSTSRTTALKKTTATRSRVRKSEPAARTAPEPVTHDAIAARAYDLFVRSGFQHGRDVEFWLEAERQVKDGVKV